MQTKLLGLAWFYSSYSRLINGLRAIPNKNFSPRSVSSSAAVSSGHGVAPALSKGSMTSDFCKDISEKSAFRVPGAPPETPSKRAPFSTVKTQLAPYPADRFGGLPPSKDDAVDDGIALNSGRSPRRLSRRLHASQAGLLR